VDLEFPGGKCEPGESLADAARRELREELGVEVVAVGEEEFVLRDPDSPYLIHFVSVEIVGEPSCSEHIDLRWVSLAEGSNFAVRTDGSEVRRGTASPSALDGGNAVTRAIALPVNSSSRERGTPDPQRPPKL